MMHHHFVRRLRRGFAPNVHAPAQFQETYAGASCAKLFPTSSTACLSYCFHCLIADDVTMRQAVRRTNGITMRKLPKCLAHGAIPLAHRNPDMTVHEVLRKTTTGVRP